MKNYWKRFGAWATGSKGRPFHSARLKLTGLYILNTVIILGAFVIVQRYFHLRYLQADLIGKFAPGVDGPTQVSILYSDLNEVTALLLGMVIIAMAVLNYFFVRFALKPIRAFVEAQRRFISDASHELRTPLATVKTENEVALLDPASITREDAVSILRSNVEEIDRISTILNNLLNLASFNSATGAPPLTSVNLSAIATLISNRMRMLAERKKINLRVTKPQTLLVWGNATALEEVLSNLLKNAIQYTPIDGQVTLTLHAEADKEKALIMVQDTGSGIAPKDLPYIFEPFYRSDSTFHMHQQGTGLGLPLVREIVKRHGGKIRVESALGKGTTVLVELPLAPTPATTAQ